MYSRLRTTMRRKSSENGTRKQRGGASFAKPLAWPELDKAADLAFLKTGITTVDQYFTLVERQDEFMNVVMERIYNTAELKDAASRTEEAIIAKVGLTNSNKTIPISIIAVLKEAEQCLCLTTPVNGGTTRETKRKLEQIRKEINSNCLELLVNPAQLQNSFIRELATLCILLKNNAYKLDTDALRLARALRLEAISESNAYATTSSFLRDGFHAAQNIGQFRTILGHDKGDIGAGFWYKVLGSNLTPTNQGNERWVYYTKLILEKYKAGEPDLKMAVLAAINTIIKTPLPKSAANPFGRSSVTSQRAAAGAADVVENGRLENEPGKPTANLDQPIGGTSVTLNTILSKISMGDLHFILHLCYTITALEAVVLQEQKGQPTTPEIAGSTV